jgi:FkbM family methyltransferase
MNAEHTSETPLLAKWHFLKTARAFRRAPLHTLARLAQWRLHCALDRPAHVRLSRWGVECFLPAQWRGISKLLYAFGEDYEPELIYLEKLLTRGGVFVDVGACFGVYALAASSIVGTEGKVVAFEPAAEASSVLQRNIQLNHSNNVTAFRMALADQDAILRLYHHPDASRNSLGSRAQTNQEFEEVQTRTLDEVLHEIGLSHVDVIKMDVEGAEELVLRGATNLLASSHPTIIFEINRDAAPRLGLLSEEAWNLLMELGYKFYSVRGSGDSPTPKVTPFDGNVVAIHCGSG